MTEPKQAVVNADGEITSIIICTNEVAQQFRDLGWVEMLWPGCELVSLIGLNPEPHQGWTWDGQTWTAPPPPPEPEPEPEPAAEAT